jgi:S1-C subfamily serine protease
VNALDIGILVVAAFAMLGGWRLGFFGRVFSWLGLGAGLYLAVRFMPNIVNFVGLTGSVARMVLAVGVLVGGALIGQGLGLMIGSRLHSVLPPFAGLRVLDRLVGAFVGVLGVFAALWLLAPSLAAVQGSVSQLTTGSVITRWLSNETRAYGLSPPNTLQALRRLVSQDGFPQVFDQIIPGQDVGPPPGSVPLAPAVVTSVSASTVKVEGEACGRIQEGSGWTVDPGLVVTNAHVVAGEPAGSTSVLLPNGTVKPATVVEYNPDVDLALLSVPGLGEPPLPVGSGSVGEKGAVFGHPNGEDPLDIQPATIAQEVTAVGQDLYGNRSIERRVFVLASQLTYGDSGAPVVGPDGRVVGIAFAIAPDRPTTAYALSSSELTPILVQPHTAAVSTNKCVSS